MSALQSLWKKVSVLTLGIVSATFVFAAVGISDVSSVAHANALGTDGIQLDATGDETDIKSKVVSIINQFLLFLGLVLLVIIIYAGFTIITSDGEEEGLTKGRKMIIYAIIGVIVIFLSYSITNWIAELGTGGDTITA